MSKRRRSGLAQIGVRVREVRGLVNELDGLTKDVTKLVGSLGKLIGALSLFAAPVLALYRTLF